MDSEKIEVRIDSDKIEVLILDTSDFINKYVEEYKKELEELRAKATASGSKAGSLSETPSTRRSDGSTQPHHSKKRKFLLASFCMLLMRTIFRRLWHCVATSRWRSPSAPAAINTADIHRRHQPICRST